LLSLNLLGGYGVSSYVGVGFSLNPVAQIQGSYNGQADDKPSDYTAKIDWGDGSSSDNKTWLVSGGISGDSGYVLVKGSHIYQQQGTFEITVSVTGPGGQSISGDTATATVVPMPDEASVPPDVPTAYKGPEPLAYESLNLLGGYGVTSYVGVGFGLNPVAQIQGTYNGQADDTVSDYHAQINWGDSPSWDKNVSLVSGGKSGDSGYVLIKGSHIYKQQGTYDITVYVTGPDGQTISGDTATATAIPMPDEASEPITVPTEYEGAEPLAYESLNLLGGYGVTSYVGAGFSLNPIAQIQGTYNGQADDTVSDYHAQINWGDGNTWDTKVSLVSGGINGDSGYVLIKGSHIYQQQGTYDITVYVTGPDGQTISGDTATATAIPMPDAASRPPDVPTEFQGAEPLAYESLNLLGGYGVQSYVGAGFSLNPIAQIQGTYNGQADDTVSDYHAQINWGDSPSWDTNVSLVSGGKSGDSGYVLIKGSHIYKQQGTYDVTVYVTGPDGQTISGDTATATAIPMPDEASEPITVPTDYQGPKQLAYESLNLLGGYGVSSDSGIAINLSPIAQIQGTYNGQADDNASDYHAQINWGDGNTWDTKVSLAANGISGDSGYVLINGSHTYQQQGTYDITVYVTGPDGQTISGDTATATIAANPNAITVGSLSPTEWQVDQPNYDGTIPVSGGSGAYQNLQIPELPSGLMANVLTQSLNGQQIGTIDITGTPTESGTFTLHVSVQDGSGNSGSATETLKITAAPITIGTLSPSQWQVNQPNYDGAIAVSGGTGSYSDLSVTGLPNGLSDALSGSTITISGTPTQTGTFNNIAVSLKDSGGNSGSGTESLTIAAPSITLGRLSPTQWQVNQPNYDGTIPLSGGSGAYQNLQIPELPSGLSANVLTQSLNGQQIGTIDITGTPTESGTFTLHVSVQDGSGNSGSATETLTITAAPITVGSLSPAQWDLNEPGYYGMIAVSGGTGSYSSLSVTGLPNGLSAALSGSTINVIGTPTQSGTFSDIAVSLKDTGGTMGQATESLTINPAVTLGDLSPAEWTVNEPGYDGTIDVSGGTGGYQNLQVTGLPQGLSYALQTTAVVINGQMKQSGTINITGTPTESGNFTVYVSLQDGAGEWATHQSAGVAALHSSSEPLPQTEPPNHAIPEPLKIDPAPSPVITLTEATTLDSRSVTVSYSIAGSGLLQPLDFNVYRSDQPHEDASSVLLGKATIDPQADPQDLQVGPHTVRLLEGTHLPPNGILPYVIVVCNPDHSIHEGQGSVDTAYFEKFLLGVVVNGYQLIGTTTPAWVSQMANSLQSVDHYSQTIQFGIIGRFNWVVQSRASQPGQALRAGDVLAHQVVVDADRLAQAHLGDVVDLHFIGHSRGAVAINRALVDLTVTQTTDKALTGSYIIFTMLDPHPAFNYPEGTVFYSAGPSHLSGFLNVVRQYIDFQDAAADPPEIIVPANVNALEVFYQHTPATRFHQRHVLRQPNEYYLNLWGAGEDDHNGNTPIISWSNHTLSDIHWYPLAGKLFNNGPIGHSEVHEYYRVEVVQAGKTLVNAT
jgi:hypothetical protein